MTTTGTRTAKAAATKTAAAKKTADTKPATKPTAKRASTRSPRKPATKAAPARPLSLVKLAKNTRRRKPASTLVDLRTPLPVRRRLFVGPMGATEQAAVRAALAAAAARLPIPVRTWNGSTAHLTDGTLLTHNPGPDRTFTAHIACRHGAIHGWPIHTHRDLREARALTRACQHPHGGVNADQAITDGVSTIPPKPDPVLALRDGIRRAAKTQPLSADEIAAGLTARAADTETPKEHPET